MSRPGCLRTGFELTDRDHFLLMNALIRLEQSSDAAAIDYVLRSAFPTDQEARLVDLLRKHQRLRLSLIAEIDGVIVGHIAFSQVTIAGSVANSTGLGLAPLSIVAELQRRGLGAELVGEGLRACERLGAGFVVVLGEPEYYHRFALEGRIFSDWKMNTAPVKHLWR